MPLRSPLGELAPNPQLAPRSGAPLPGGGSSSEPGSGCVPPNDAMSHATRGARRPLDPHRRLPLLRDGAGVRFDEEESLGDEIAQVRAGGSGAVASSRCDERELTTSTRR